MASADNRHTPRRHPQWRNPQEKRVANEFKATDNHELQVLLIAHLRAHLVSGESLTCCPSSMSRM
jgi:hypothetical protein